MTHVAHLSDFHLVEPGHAERRGQDWWRLHYLSLRRPIDAEGRIARARAALDAAAGADHLVITGDLTEDARDAQFSLLAELLAASPFLPEQVTLVPGNHDAYAPDAWSRALDGPLAAWAPTSRGLVDLADALLVPLSTAVEQFWTRSSGALAELPDLGTLLERARDRAVLVALHHPPFRVLHHWIHGLSNHVDVHALLAAHPSLHCLHGHTHRATTRAVDGGAPRLFCVEAVAESAAPGRSYQVADGRMAPG